MKPDGKLWTKDFIIVSGVNFLVTLVFYLLIVIIGVYAVGEYGATASEAGLITGLFIVGALAGRLFTGRSIESLGRKRTLFIGLILFALTTALYFIQLGIPFLMLTRFLHGAAMGMASTATGTIVAQIIPQARKGEGIGYYSMSATLATAIGPFIGLYMSSLTGMTAIFGLCLAVSFIGLAVALFLRVPESENVPEVHGKKGFSLSGIVEPRAIPIALVTMVVAFCYSGVLSFINSYSIEIDLVSAASFFFLIYSVSVLLSRPFTGRLMDVKGANAVMYPAFVLFAAGLVLLGTAQNGLMLLASGILIGLGFGNMQSCTQAVAVKLTPPHRMGLATSTFFIALDAGLGFGPFLIGFLIPYMSFSTLYLILALVVLVSALLYFSMHGKKEKAGLQVAGQ
ncbi:MULTISPECIES: MFS transporter [Bhargavaea]|uniref:MFS transporter n=1 Tax=Bhargavaea changchunensis TaxID=2134037 RepID=A0ABW2NFH8_9BACL|nr:MFS transporter [Bhargavaea sp. CC-171006]